jgi:preprotein translocase subunit SecG
MTVDRRLLILALIVGALALLAVVLIDHATAGDLARSSWG